VEHPFRIKVRNRLFISLKSRKRIGEIFFIAFSKNSSEIGSGGLRGVEIVKFLGRENTLLEFF